MKFLILNILNIFDFFYKKAIKKEIIKIFGHKIGVFFDVGAHRGETIKFINSFITVKKIYAFEPLKQNFQKLLKNTRYLSLKNEIKLFFFEIALGEFKEKKKMKEMDESSSSTLNEINKNSKYFKRKKAVLGLGVDKEFYCEKEVNIIKASSVIKKHKIKSIDLLKIDTEGYEFSVIKGFEKSLSKVKVILFEHHYNLMIKKKYTFSDIHNYLRRNNFILKKKFKMPLRKTFEYIYCNKDYF